MDIDSESKLIWKIIKEILLTPFKIILIPFGKYSISDLFAPIIEVYNFLMQSKFTLFMIIANIIVFGLEIIYGEQFVGTFSTFPSDILIPSRYFSLITAGFIHYGFEHIIWNMLALFIFGRVVEKKIGTMKTFLAYFGALIFANIFADVMYLYTKPDLMLAGASGAIMGLIALATLLAPFQLTFISLIPSPIMILGWLYLLLDITGIMGTVDDGVAHFAHIGGFISVTVIYLFFNQEEKSKLKKGLIINIISLVLLGLIYYFFLK